MLRFQISKVHCSYLELAVSKSRKKLQRRLGYGKVMEDNEALLGVLGIGG